MFSHGTPTAIYKHSVWEANMSTDLHRYLEIAVVTKCRRYVFPREPEVDLMWETFGWKREITSDAVLLHIPKSLDFPRIVPRRLSFLFRYSPALFTAADTT